jgi:hypothetical protein
MEKLSKCSLKSVGILLSRGFYCPLCDKWVSLIPIRMFETEQPLDSSVDEHHLSDARSVRSLRVPSGISRYSTERLVLPAVYRTTVSSQRTRKPLRRSPSFKTSSHINLLSICSQKQGQFYGCRPKWSIFRRTIDTAIARLAIAKLTPLAIVANF